MTRTFAVMFLTVLTLGLLVSPASGWWDSQLVVSRPISLVREFRASDLPGVPEAAVVEDVQADGGRGGPVINTDLCNEFKVTLPLEASHYAFVVIGRGERAATSPLQGRLYVRLELQAPDGSSHAWRMRCNYTDSHADIAQIYFPVYEAGEYTATLSIHKDPTFPLLVDRLELRDALGNIPKVGAKTRRMLLDDEELERARHEYRQANAGEPSQFLDACARQSRNEALWLSWPPRNALRGDVADVRRGPLKTVLDNLVKKADLKSLEELMPWQATQWDEPWGFRHHGTGEIYSHANYEAGEACGGEAPWADAGDGALFSLEQGDKTIAVPWPWMAANNQARIANLLKHLTNLAKRYQLTGDEDAAWDASILLAALADLYPSFDYRYQDLGMQIGVGAQGNRGRFGFNGGGFGKIRYNNWESEVWLSLCAAYDQLFDFMKDNTELARFVGERVPAVRVPADLTAMIDINILQHGVDCFRRRQITAEDEDKAHMAALILGPGEVAEWVLDVTTFHCVDMRMTNAGGLDDHTFSSFTREGTGIIGSLGYSKPDGLIRNADRLQRFVAAGGDPRYDLSDRQRFPVVAGAASSFFDFYVAGGFSPIQGDSRDPFRSREMPDAGRRDLYAAAFRWTGDPRHAWMLAKVCGRHHESDAQWALITKAAQDQRDPRLAQKSRVLGGAGFAILESGQESDDFRFKQSAVLTYVTGVGHAHQDTLDLGLFGFGCRLAPDLGGRHEGRNRGTPNMRSNRAHNLVEVDERNFQNLTPGSTTAGTGWTELFKPLPGTQVVTASARATSHPHLSVYQRGIALIDVHQGRPAESPPSESVYSTETRHDPNVVMPATYVFDVFRVAGGRTHTYCFHGAQSGFRGKAITDIQINTDLSPASSPTSTSYLRGMGTPREGRAGEVLEVSWQLDRDAERRFLHADFNPNAPPKHTRLSLMGHAGAHVMVANAFSDRYKYDWPFLYVQQQSRNDRDIVFPAIIEMSEGESSLLSKRLLVAPAPGEDALAPVAVEVRTTNGFTDILYNSGRPEVHTVTDDESRLTGRFAFVRNDADGPLHAAVIGGSRVAAAGDRMVLEPEVTHYDAKVVSIDINSERLTLDRELPRALIGEEVLIGSPANWTSFTIADITTQDGISTVAFTRSGRIYRSKVTFVNEDTNSIACEIPPPFFRADPHYYDGGHLVNEAGTHAWRVAGVTADERWMHLGWPGFRGSFPVDIADADVTDADGDGKRTLRLHANDEAEQATDRFGGRPYVALEVTRIDADNATFYFRTPEHEPWTSDGWGYNARRLTNEAGTRTWEARYPGDQYQFSLTGEPVTQTSFRNADGMTRIQIFRFAPGNTMRIEAHAAVRRIQDGIFELRANTAVSVRLPEQVVAIRTAAGEQVVSEPNAHTSIRIESKWLEHGDRILLITREASRGLAENLMMSK